MPHATVHGLRMFYEWHGDGPGPPVALVMGLGGDSTAWGLQLAALAPAHRCLVLDNRGVGRTDAPDTPSTIATMAGDLLGLLDALDVPRAHLLGASLGGAIVQEAALAAPDRVVSLQLHGTWPGPDPHLGAVLQAFRLMRLGLGREDFARAVLPWIFTPACYAERPEFVDLVVQRTVAHPYPPPLHGYLRQVEAALTHDTRGRLGRIRCPTLVTVGAEDILTPARFARELAARIPGARLEVLPAGHGYFWEAPAAFNAASRDFLAGVPDPKTRAN